VIVVDASAALELVVNSPRAPGIARRLLSGDESLHAPHLIDLEVAQVLRRWEHRREITAARARQALDDFRDLPLARYPHTLFLERVWLLRRNATAYDAAYLALAEALGATLLTCDAALASVPGHSVRVEVAD
jgi:predicted nucleic acid-binding protein